MSKKLTHRSSRLVVVVIITSAALFSLANAAANDAASQGIVECTQQHIQKHNPGLANNDDRLICFDGYVSNFNTAVAIVVRNKPRHWAVPRWVIHHIQAAATTPETNDRPQTWFTIPDLRLQGIAPTDASYVFSKKFRQKHSNWYERGHLAQKYLLERVSANAAWFTHNVANAVPQRGQFNKATWLTLECYTGAWANKYGEVWVIVGPIFGKGRISWLKSDRNRNALSVSIPRAIFKIVLKKTAQGKWESLSFVMPQTHKTYKKGPFDPGVWFKSINEIERMTGGTFLNGLDISEQSLKRDEPTELWPIAATDFDIGCKNQKANIQ